VSRTSLCGHGGACRSWLGYRGLIIHLGHRMSLFRRQHQGTSPLKRSVRFQAFGCELIRAAYILEYIHYFTCGTVNPACARHGVWVIYVFPRARPPLCEPEVRNEICLSLGFRSRCTCRMFSYVLKSLILAKFVLHQSCSHKSRHVAARNIQGKLAETITHPRVSRKMKSRFENSMKLGIYAK
jgi:hypothetical protein